MGFKLGDISPIAGVLSGKGLMGKLAGTGGLGVLPYLINKDAKDDAANEVLANAEMERKKEAAQLANARNSAAQTTSEKNSETKMKRGGSVSSASKRADGIATKGKTRGKMC